MTAARLDPSVSAFLDERNHPLRTAIDRLRQVVLSADPRITETIKWGGPTFVLADSRANLATMVLRGQSALTLFFQDGASLPNPNGLLSGSADQVRTARFDSIAAIDRSADALQQVVRDFCDANGGTTG